MGYLVVASRELLKFYTHKPGGAVWGEAEPFHRKVIFLCFHWRLAVEGIPFWGCPGVRVSSDHILKVCECDIRYPTN